MVNQTGTRFREKLKTTSRGVSDFNARPNVERLQSKVFQFHLKSLKEKIFDSLRHILIIVFKQGLE